MSQPIVVGLYEPDVDNNGSAKLAASLQGLKIAMQRIAMSCSQSAKDYHGKLKSNFMGYFLKQLAHLFACP